MPDDPVQVRLAAAQVEAVSKAQATASHVDIHRINLPEAREGAMIRILVFMVGVWVESSGPTPDIGGKLRAKFVSGLHICFGP